MDRLSPQLAVLGRKKDGVLVLWSFTAQLICASSRGQIRQSLLDSALSRPPGFHRQRIQLRYNNLTPLKQLDPVA